MSGKTKAMLEQELRTAERRIRELESEVAPEGWGVPQEAHNALKERVYDLENDVRKIQTGMAVGDAAMATVFERLSVLDEAEDGGVEKRVHDLENASDRIFTNLEGRVHMLESHLATLKKLDETDIGELERLKRSVAKDKEIEGLKEEIRRLHDIIHEADKQTDGISDLEERANASAAMAGERLTEIQKLRARLYELNQEVSRNDNEVQRLRRVEHNLRAHTHEQERQLSQKNERIKDLVERVDELEEKVDSQVALIKEQSEAAAERVHAAERKYDEQYAKTTGMSELAGRRLTKIQELADEVDRLKVQVKNGEDIAKGMVAQATRELQKRLDKENGDFTDEMVGSERRFIVEWLYKHAEKIENEAEDLRQSMPTRSSVLRIQAAGIRDSIKELERTTRGPKNK